LSLEQDINALQQVELLSGFDRDHLRLLAFGSQQLSFSKGYDIFYEGQKSDSGYLVLSGLISVSIRQDGEPVHKADHGPGAMLGELALISETVRTYTATVKENCSLLKIPRTTMHRVLSEYPDLAIDLHRRISRDVSKFLRQLPEIQAKLSG
jgi:CRP-like cAMP-binding protein